MVLLDRKRFSLSLLPWLTLTVFESDGRQEGEGHSVRVGEGLLERVDCEQVLQPLEVDTNVLLGV